METESQTKSSNSMIVVIIILAIIAVVAWYFFTKEHKAPVQPVVEQMRPIKQAKPIEPVKNISEPKTSEIIPPVDEPEEEEPAVVEPKNQLPALDHSDPLIQDKLTSLTWRKELLKLVINDDMIRRFVVFVDNFSRGIVAYKHSPFVKPSTGFTVKSTDLVDQDKQRIWAWDEHSARRFSLYVDLLRSFDSESLVNWYIEIKPLINEAYAELGYPDQNFSDVLQLAISRVLDMEIPDDSLTLVRPSVMYKFENKDIESLDEADKLLLRIGKENLLIIKSVLLELNEKISRAENG